MRPRIHFALLTIALSTAVFTCSSSAAPQRGAEARWRGWNPGLKEASATHRPVLVDVYTDWCGWCKRMDRDVYSQPEVRDYLSQHFVAVRLNAESPEPLSYEGRDESGPTLAARFRVSGYPTTIFLRESGEHLVNVPGYVPADRFLLVLRFIGEGHLDRGESFETFVQGARASRAGR